MRHSRLNMIEQYIVKNQTVSIDDLCETFSVSKNTIRRDLAVLEERGHIAKVYGGVTVKEHDHTLRHQQERLGTNRQAKEQIGKRASTLVSAGDTLFIDSGSTALCVLPYLTGLEKLTVISHSLSALSLAASAGSFNIIGLGGNYSKPTDSFVGLWTIEALVDLKISKAFMAATGVSMENGLTNTTYHEAEIKRGVVSRSQQIILTADSSKIGRDALITFCRLDQISAIVTDRKPPEPYLKFFKTHDIQTLYGDNA